MQQNSYRFPPRSFRVLWTLAVVASLSACSVTPRHAAPVEDRPMSGGPKVSVPPASAPGQAASAPADAKLLPGAENAGKPGYYTVKPGDTLIRIALDNGQNWRDLVKWNGLDKPNVIEIGQVLRVVPPGVDPTLVATRPIAPGKVEDPPAGEQAGRSRLVGGCLRPGLGCRAGGGGRGGCESACGSLARRRR